MNQFLVWLLSPSLVWQLVTAWFFCHRPFWFLRELHFMVHCLSGHGSGKTFMVHCLRRQAKQSTVTIQPKLSGRDFGGFGGAGRWPPAHSNLKYVALPSSLGKAKEFKKIHSYYPAKRQWQPLAGTLVALVVPVHRYQPVQTRRDQIFTSLLFVLCMPC